MTKPVRDGFHTVTPYRLAEGVVRLITFVSEAFEGVVLSRETRQDGSFCMRKCESVTRWS